MHTGLYQPTQEADATAIKKSAQAEFFEKKLNTCTDFTFNILKFYSDFSISAIASSPNFTGFALPFDLAIACPTMDLAAMVLPRL